MNLVLKKFMIFDSSEGQDEGRERDKLLYHWSKDVENDGRLEINEQINDICLCDASISASKRLGSGLNSHQNSESNTFTDSQDSDGLDPTEPNPFSSDRHLILTFETTVIVMVEIEPTSKIWLAVHVSPSGNIDSNESLPQSTSGLSPDAENIPTDAIRLIIKNIYSRFCLINGTFQMLKEQNGDKEDRNSQNLRASCREAIRAICDEYFNAVLPEIHLSSTIYNVASLYNHLTYLDLNPLTLMKVTSFINHLICLDPKQIRHTVVIFNDQLLWSSLNALDSRLVFNYMVGVLIRDALQEELSRETEKVRRIKENMPIYLSKSIGTTEEGISAINIRNDGLERLTKSYLTVFRSSNNMTLGLIFKDANKFDLIRKCEQILTSDSRLGVIPLASLANSVGQNFLRATTHLTGSSTFATNQQNPSSSNSSTTRRRGSGSSASLSRNSIPIDQKYLCLDRLDSSVSNSFSLDAQSRDHNPTAESSNDATSNRKLRLFKHVIELEPELRDIQQTSHRRVEEYLGKTIGDTWFTVTNSKYRCIYSVYRARNAGLGEAHQAANNLRVALLSSRSWRFLIN